jgi:iron(III) transport system permease protein
MTVTPYEPTGAVPPSRPERFTQALPRLWTYGTLLISAIVAVPVLTVVWVAFTPSGDIWDHLVSTVLPGYIRNTILLMLGVGLLVFVVGTGTAWLVSSCRFPGRAVFEWALLLPLAVPAYIIAFTYTDLLEFAGPVQKGLRALFGWGTVRDYWFPEIRSLGGAVAMLSLVLYPYVYLLARAAFLEQCVCVLEVGRTLGHGPWRGFLTLALPLARPAIVVGVTLALMETISDFGTVQYFAVNTFTTGIYKVWLGMYSAPGAAQLSSLLLVFVLALILTERWSRGRQRYHPTTTRYRDLPRYRLEGWRAAAAVAACLLPVTLGFLVPGYVLLRNAVAAFDYAALDRFLLDLVHSLGLAATAATAAVMLAAFMAYGVRLHGGAAVRAATRAASLGYAVPGSVIAVGVLIPFGALDNAVDGVMRRGFGISTGLLLSGTVFAMLFAYVVRFLALSFGTVEASLAKVTPSMDGAARSLGQGPLGTLLRIHVPMIRGSLLTAGLLVFVDVMKELPASIILRPFNFNTLAIRAYEYAADELLEEASIWALAIVVAGIIPVILLSRMIRHSRPGHTEPLP